MRGIKQEPYSGQRRPCAMSRPLAAVALSVVAAASIALLPASRALACSCVGFTENQAFENADVVFVGVAVESSASPFLAGSADPIEFTFAVEKQLKGEQLPQVVTVVTAASGASCGAGFQVGERWRVFANPDGLSLTSGLCNGNRLLDESAPVSPVPDEGGGMSSAPMEGIFGLGVLAILVVVALFLFGIRGRA